MTHRFIVSLTSTMDWAISFLRANYYLLKKFSCPNCLCETKEEIYNKYKEKICFKCPECLNRYSIRVNSFVSDSKISLFAFIDFLYFYFYNNIHIFDLEKESDLSNKPIIQFRKLFREIMLETRIRSLNQLGDMEKFPKLTKH